SRERGDGVPPSSPTQVKGQKMRTNMHVLLTGRLRPECNVAARTNYGHGAPVRSFHTFPLLTLITVRWSRHCPPRPPHSGRSGSKLDHARSVYSPRPTSSPRLAAGRNEGSTSRQILTPASSDKP